MSLSTDSYKGVRDFYPQDQAIQEYIFSVFRKVAERFGYEEYGASLLEPSELYRAKSSQEIVTEQTYSFRDRGEREVTLRPEMTPTVARMVAARRRELVFPLRWFSIPNLFRYENPQRGRLREHWQLNVDLFGGTERAADLEIIVIAHALLLAFGATEKDFEIRINSRKDMPSDPAALRLLDKKAKMSASEFEKEAQKLSLSTTFTESPEMKKFISLLHMQGISNARYAPEVVRGFDYYTGMVFEIFDSNSKNARSLFGGGRYDNLMELFGNEKTPAVGFGAGDVTLRDFLETHNLLPAKIWPTYKAKTHIQLCLIEGGDQEKVLVAANNLAQELRKHNLNVAVDLSGKKLGDQIKHADKRGVPYIIAIGESELSSRTFKLKNLASGEEQTLSTISAIAEAIK